MLFSESQPSCCPVLPLVFLPVCFEAPLLWLQSQVVIPAIHRNGESSAQTEWITRPGRCKNKSSLEHSAVLRYIQYWQHNWWLRQWAVIQDFNFIADFTDPLDNSVRVALFAVSVQVPAQEDPWVLWLIFRAGPSRLWFHGGRSCFLFWVHATNNKGGHGFHRQPGRSGNCSALPWPSRVPVQGIWSVYALFWCFTWAVRSVQSKDGFCTWHSNCSICIKHITLPEHCTLPMSFLPPQILSGLGFIYRLPWPFHCSEFLMDSVLFMLPPQFFLFSLTFNFD